METGLEHLATLAAAFKSAGGSVAGPIYDKKSLRALRRPLVARKSSMDEERYMMVANVLSAKEANDTDTVYVALDEAGRAVGVCKCEEFWAYKTLQVNFLGSTGEVRGAGAALLAAAAAHAGADGWGLGVLGEDAEEYYEKLGMHETPEGMVGVSHWWTPEEVAVAAGLAMSPEGPAA
jgi:hypothetical protein